ncbi:MAG TPA: hypothetical protein ENJ28_09360 [Gammaproteobacteria bacterium]|nr:hypothetical protein [Gammaproteobacteria bacterium]
MRSLKSWWQTFTYNYGWSDYIGYIDGWIPKLALSVPIVGYLILFNDSVSDILSFKHLAKEEINNFGLEGASRLRLLYFGLIFLGVSNFIYRIKKPYIFKFGKNLIDYTKNSLYMFTLGDYINVHGTIRREGHLTLSGKYYDSEWDGFLEAAKNTGEGTEKVIRDGDWESAKSKYGGLLRDMLRENFFRNDKKGRFWLSVCLILSSIGYLFLAVPSIDLFLKVVVSTFYGAT